MKRISVLLTSLALASTYLPATAQAEGKERSGFDKAWSYMTLYENKESSIIQKFSIVGRIQLDSVWVDPDTVWIDPEDVAGSETEKYNDVSWRRARLGFKAKMFNDWTAHIEADWKLNEPIDQWYNKLTDAYLAWQPTKELKIKALKQSAGFTLDGATSSKRLLTMERNNLTNNLWFTKEYFTGILASGKFAGNGSYKGSFFSSGGDPGWDFDSASWFTFWSVGYKLGNTKLALDYVYQDEDENANTRDFEQVFSLHGQWQNGPWGIRGDLSGGKGFEDLGQSDVWGLYIMPSYDITEHTQVVLAYTYVASDEDNGVRLPRYEDKAVGGRGNNYNEYYAGFNVFFYGHKFKWQTGLSWADMDDDADDGGEYEGWNLTTGLRVYW
ncbi:MAG: porin [Thermodesulfobacteriota bacterium]|nr:porin [Thermodesulfobacteriota bacterium]